MQFSNKKSIPLSIAVWLAHNDYPEHKDPKTISVTSLLKPTREIALCSQNKDKMDMLTADVFDLIPSSLGTAIHAGIEHAWLSPRLKKTLESLGQPKQIIDRLVVNPSEKDFKAKPDLIPVYLEQRYTRTLKGWTITGAMDFIGGGGLEDFKSTSVWSHIFGSNDEKYILQGSIYRWITPDRIRRAILKIQKIFTDWKKKDALQDKKGSYPQSRLLMKTFALMGVEETENWISNRLDEIEFALVTEQKDLPLCTPDELWQKDDTWKYYKNPKKMSRATKNFTKKDYTNPAQAAHQRLVDDGEVGTIVFVPGEVVKCKYCSARPFCEQAKNYKLQGLIKELD